MLELCIASKQDRSACKQMLSHEDVLRVDDPLTSRRSLFVVADLQLFTDRHPETTLHVDECLLHLPTVK